MDCPPGEINPYQKVSQVLIYIVTLLFCFSSNTQTWYDSLMRRIPLVVAVDASTFLFNNRQSSSLFIWLFVADTCNKCTYKL